MYSTVLCVHLFISACMYAYIHTNTYIHIHRVHTRRHTHREEGGDTQHRQYLISPSQNVITRQKPRVPSMCHTLVWKVLGYTTIRPGPHGASIVMHEVQNKQFKIV